MQKNRHAVEGICGASRYQGSKDNQPNVHHQAEGGTKILQEYPTLWCYL